MCVREREREEDNEQAGRRAGGSTLGNAAPRHTATPQASREQCGMGKTTVLSWHACFGAEPGEAEARAPLTVAWCLACCGAPLPRYHATTLPRQVLELQAAQRGPPHAHL